MTRLLRSLHTTARAANSAIANAAASGQTSATNTIANSTTTSSSIPASWAAQGVRDWTPKGRPVPLRPARETRVTLPSGYPEPPSYPPPASYWAELDEIDKTKGKPRPHPLWAFFHVPPQHASRPEGNDAPENMGSLDLLQDEEEGLKSGRSWTAAELRLKSFEDLHVLWYVLLRERNVLLTQEEERRRLGVVDAYGGDLIRKRGYRCRKSMARIKYVLNERRLALIAAGAATLPAPSGVSVPTTLPGRNDPMAAVEALAGVTPVPDVVKLTEGKRTRLSGQETELFEEDEEDRRAWEEVEKEEGKKA